jgi:pimeloyl-ACP methyl ester carboxylesterase
VRPIVGPRDHVVLLADHRLLGYADYGDPQGHPVVNCHGGLACRLDVEPADEAARSAGVRLISPDRPGVGLSSRQPGRRIGAWADDVAALADALDVETFSVMGWSFGAAYAAACAARLPERVRSATLIAGAVPPTWPCASRGFENATDAALARLCRWSPPLACATMRLAGELAARAPRLWLRLGSGELSPRDLEVIERDGLEGFAAAIAEGVRCPGGAVDDYLAYDAPWGFGYEEIRVPVSVWQGDEDRLLPISWSEEAARRIGGARLRLVLGCGHLVARDHWAEIFAELVAAPPAPG